MTLRPNLTIAVDGSVEIPANMLAELGLQHGGKVLARLENGSLILEPINVAIRRAQAMARKYVPDDVDLVAELIAERRAAAELE
jgi:antitoxin component of MazEF toxin-antitoxin module